MVCMVSPLMTPRDPGSMSMRDDRESMLASSTCVSGSTSSYENGAVRLISWANRSRYWKSLFCGFAAFFLLGLFIQVSYVAAAQAKTPVNHAPDFIAPLVAYTARIRVTDLLGGSLEHLLQSSILAEQGVSTEDQHTHDGRDDQEQDEFGDRLLLDEHEGSDGDHAEEHGCDPRFLRVFPELREAGAAEHHRHVHDGEIQVSKHD